MSLIINKKNTSTGFKTVVIIILVCMCIALVISTVPIIIGVLAVILPILAVCAIGYFLVCLIGAGVNVVKKDK
jgi:hypothetical protein